MAPYGYPDGDDRPRHLDPVPDISFRIDGARDQNPLIALARRYRADPLAVPAARGELREALDGQVDEETLGDLTLAVTELATNAVRHAHSEWFSVELRAADGRVRLEVCDGGSGFDPSAGEPDAVNGGGYGLCIVERLADRWGVEREERGVRVWLELPVRRD